MNSLGNGTERRCVSVGLTPCFASTSSYPLEIVVLSDAANVNINFYLANYLPKKSKKILKIVTWPHFFSSFGRKPGHRSKRAAQSLRRLRRRMTRWGGRRVSHSLCRRMMMRSRRSSRCRSLSSRIHNHNPERAAAPRVWLRAPG